MPRKGKIIWLTGLPCSGKTTIANELKKYFKHPLMLDGDVIRGTAISNWDFSPEGRKKHLLKMGTIARLTADVGRDVICSFVSPNVAVREEIKAMCPTFFEVFVKCPVEKCEERDVKGMYAKARRGEIKGFTGIDAPYEEPEAPDVVVDTSEETLEESVTKILGRINEEFAALVFPGRWQTGIGLHEGHKTMIRNAIGSDDFYQRRPIVIQVRDMLPGPKDPFNAEDIRKDIEEQFENGNVIVQIVPDFKCIFGSRGVGWDFQLVQVSKKIADKYSGTKIRAELEKKRNADSV